MSDPRRYRFSCSLTFGDIYGQIIVWLAVVFVSLAVAMASMVGSGSPIYAFAAVGLILVVTLPFLLFAFVTTLFNHIEAVEIKAEQRQQVSSAPSPSLRANPGMAS